MPSGVRHSPHLRLTAAILVALLAALTASADGSSDGRTRRDGVATSLRLLGSAGGECDAPCGPASLPIDVGCPAAAAGQPELSASAVARAERALRRGASGPRRVARLRTIALPPPRA